MFHVKRFAKPKAKDATLRIIAVLIYILGVSTFIALYITQRKTYTNETQIEVSDISDSEWSCSMASVVSQSVTVNGTESPVELYNLMSVNELKSQCLSSLYSANPCSNVSSILFTPGSTNAFGRVFEMVSASPASAANGNVFHFSVFESNDSPLLAFMYDASSGILTPGPVNSRGYQSAYLKLHTEYLPSTTCTNKNGGYYVVTDTVQGLTTFYIVEFSGNIQAEFEPADNQTVLITNDNFLDAYYLRSIYVSNSTSFIHTLGSFNEFYNDDTDDYFGLFWEDFRWKTQNPVQQFGVYLEQPYDRTDIQSACYLYYISAGSLFLYYHNESVMLVQGTEDFSIGTIQISAITNKVYFTASNYSDDSSLVMSVDSSGLTSLIYSYQPANAVSSFSMINNETQLILSYNEVMYQLDLVSNSYELLQSGYTNSIAGWYVCGDEVVTTSLPTNIYSPGSCTANGITWQLQYTETYFAAASQFESQAIATAFSQCQESMYDTICDRVGTLPPYICTRKQYLPVFTVIATAIANAHILVVILFMVCGAVLSKVNSTGHKNDDAARVEMSTVSSVLKPEDCKV